MSENIKTGYAGTVEGSSLFSPIDAPVCSSLKKNQEVLPPQKSIYRKASTSADRCADYRRSLFGQVGLNTENKLELVSIIKDGLPFVFLKQLSEILDIEIKEMNEIVHISDRTFSRRKISGTLREDESERAVRVLELTVRAAEVFQSMDSSRLWLKSKQKALGGQIPLMLADTSQGADEVKDLLGRIEHGVFS